MTLAEEVQLIIEKNLYCVISTATLDGNPWTTPVFFNYDPTIYDIYWESAKDAKHSENIRQNPHVSAVIFDSSLIEIKGQAVYLTGKAYEIPPEDLPHAIEQYFGRRNQNPKRKSEEYTGNSPVRLYCFKPEKWFKLMSRKLVNGFWVDQKVEVKMKE